MADVPFPTHGMFGWDDDLKAYLDDREAKQATSFAALPDGAVGKRLRVSGTSIEAGQGPTVAAATQMATALGMTLKNVAVGGSVCPTMANLAYLTDTRWVPGTDKGLILRGSAPFNDLRFYGYPNAVELREVIGALRAEFAIYSAKEIVFCNDDRLTYSAGWTEGADSQTSGGVRAYAANVAEVATLTHTFKDDEDSACFVWTVQAGQPATIEYRRDGALMATVDYGNNTNLAKNVGYRFTRLTPGTHVLTATKVANREGGSLANAILDSALIGSTTPPPILNVLPYTLTPAGWDVSPDLGDNDVLAGWLPYVKALCAEFPNVTVVPIGSGWNPATMIGDLVHPNDLGAAYLATIYRVAAAAVVESPGLGF